jgi:hypothetical protein
MSPSWPFKYFTQTEAANGWDVPPMLHKNIIPTLFVLDLFREKRGKAIYVNSTYRDLRYNKSIGGSSRSLHLMFNAVDFTIDGDSSLGKMAELKRFYDELKAFDKKGYLYPGYGFRENVMGLGLYLRGIKSFIHIDTRGLLNRTAPARWLG